jgi:hypothetical protein
MKTMRFTSWWLVTLLIVAAGWVTACDCGDDDDDNDDTSPTDDDNDDNDASPADDDDSSPDDDDNDNNDDSSPDDDDDDDEICDWDAYDPLVTEGKDLLSAYDANTAYAVFVDAYELCPEVADAKLGILLSDVQWYAKWFKTWFEYLSTFNPSPHDNGKGVGTTIQAIVRLQLLPINAEMFELTADLRANHPDLRFFIDPFPLWIDDEHVVFEESGEWDIADVGNTEAFTRAMEAFGRILLTFDLSFDWSLFALNPAPPGATITELIHHYSGIILELLADEDYPNFLNFLEEGEADLAETAIQAGSSLLEIVDSFESMREETDPQQDDIAGYVDVNENGQWDEGEPYKIPYFGDLSPELEILFGYLLTLLDDLGAALLDGGPEDLHPSLPDWFLLSNLNFLLDFAELLFPDLELPPIPVPIGYWFYNPPDDGARTIAQTIAQFLYDYTTPDEVGVQP